MKIEEAILYCLVSQNRGMRTEQIAEMINRHRLHVRKDGQPVTSNQVYAVVCRYPVMFTKEARLHAALEGKLPEYVEKMIENIDKSTIVQLARIFMQSGISGLACKTSYCMFLLNAMQQKYSKEDLSAEKGKTAAYVIFNASFNK